MREPSVTRYGDFLKSLNTHNCIVNGDYISYKLVFYDVSIPRNLLHFKYNY